MILIASVLTSFDYSRYVITSVNLRLEESNHDNLNYYSMDLSNFNNKWNTHITNIPIAPGKYRLSELA